MRTERLALLLAAALAAAGCGAPPAPEPPRQEILSNGGRWRLFVQPPLADCAVGEPCSFAVRVEGAGGTPPPLLLHLEVDAAMPDHRHGLNLRPAVSGSALDGWRVDDLLLHMPGYWEVYFDLTEGAMTERAQAVVER